MTVANSYTAPQSLEAAADTLAKRDATLLAGGTDLLPRWKKEFVPKPPSILDLKRIDELKGVTRSNGVIRIGACTLISEIESDAAIREAAPLLAEAAGRVACPQIRNRATIGGNLCNASPAADTAVPLIVLDAVAELASAGPNGLVRREIPLVEFFRGPGTTALAPTEILTHVRFPAMPNGFRRNHSPTVAARKRWFAAWDKFGTRPAMEIAVASVGVVLRRKNGVVEHARVAYGSVAPVPLRGKRAEATLVGRSLSTETIEKCVSAARDEISPISDVRASADYRREIVGVMLSRMLEDAANG